MYHDNVFPCTHFILHKCFFFQPTFLVSISNSAHIFQKNSKTLITVKHTKESTTYYIFLIQPPIVAITWKDYSLGCSLVLSWASLYSHLLNFLYFHWFYCLWFLDSKSSYFFGLHPHLVEHFPQLLSQNRVQGRHIFWDLPSSLGWSFCEN